MIDIENIATDGISDLLGRYTNTIDNALDFYFSKADSKYQRLFDSMRYSIFSGGKRIRPSLTMMFCKLFGGNETSAVPYASAVEIIHTYSLIHDDLPCMDDDDIRRGVPTNHRKFGETTALLSGDTLLTYAFEVCALNPHVSDKSIKRAVCALSSGAGAFGMAGGQMLDFIHSGIFEPEKSGSDISFEDIKYMHELKTGALIKTASLLGYYAACDDCDMNVINDIEIYSHNIGFAFQIKDDILDATGSDEFGKPPGSDVKNGKTTVLSFMDINEAKKLAERLTTEAIEVICKYPDSDELIALAVYLLKRKK